MRRSSISLGWAVPRRCCRTELLRLPKVASNIRFSGNMATPKEGHPTRLIGHFHNRCVCACVWWLSPASPLTLMRQRTQEQQSAAWSELWESEQSDLWDRGKPSPALIDFIESQPETISRPEGGRRLRALVPVSRLESRFLPHTPSCTILFVVARSRICRDAGEGTTSSC